MNLMKEIAEKLGVEMGERFYVRSVKEGNINHNYKYYFAHNGLYDEHTPTFTVRTAPVMFSKLLNGDVEIVKIPERKHTGLEDARKDDKVYCLDNFSSYTRTREEELYFDEFTDMRVCNEWRRAIGIVKRLCKAASELNSAPIDRFDIDTDYWFIYYDGDENNLVVNWEAGAAYGLVCFETEEAAKKAIDIVGKDELIWLFRDFQPYIGAYKESEAAKQALKERENDSSRV